MFTVFVIKQNPGTVYITTPDYFSKFLQDMQVTQEDVMWYNLSMESLIMLKDNQANFCVLKLSDAS